ncbi:hypothetical protein ACWOAH_01600 [Vagococcus vulneris]|uniref:Uncharacterized protein n=1 Tax=Vagococcus vulneris TaxID=1977869 RepID=A0A430A1I1_9ENTE|nr:hypothetical protein [Vagococcus vulneris]RSU00232.1 hypothetical protein CBF37_02745 [Vagococcus vulneris]
MDNMVIVSGKPTGVNSFVINNEWNRVKIAEWRKSGIEYIGIYEVAPISAITRWAEVSQVIDSPNTNDGKQIIEIVGNINTFNPPKPYTVVQGRHYVDSQLFGIPRKNSAGSKP